MALFPPKNPAPAPAPIPMPAAARPPRCRPKTSHAPGTSVRRFADVSRQTLVGQDNLRESLITTLVAGGHILIESVPGLAKTTAAQTLATSVSGSFKTCAMHSRSDAFGPGRHSGLRFRHAEILHADRPDPRQFRAARRNQSFHAKTQSAMLEAMAEGATTIGGQRIALPKPFMVIATQNPIEEEGTFNLPEAQMDRFMMRPY